MKRPDIPFLLLLAVASVAFFIFSFNSGYGYDALEYLVIGRSLLDGYRLYDFIPSKSWGLYALMAFFLRITGGASHGGVAILTTAVFAAAVGSVYATSRRTLGTATAMLAAGVVAASAFFMEMNFLEPEGLVFLTGLGGLVLLARPDPGPRKIAAAGFVLGCGMAFKTVAGFYLVGAAVFLFLWGMFRDRQPIARLAGREACLLAGFLLAVLLPALFFAASGRLGSHIEWTYTFPLLHRPASTVWLSKLFTKLLWFVLVILAASALMFRRRIRNRILPNRRLVLSLLMGLCALGALLKQQASHYVFPGAAMLSIPIAAIFAAAAPPDTGPIRKHTLATGLALLVMSALLLASIFLYNPRSLRRFLSVKDYSDEKALADSLQSMVPPENTALFFRKNTLLYWLSHRYPNVPFVKTDVQETYFLAKQPDVLLAALEDPSLILVEYNPRSPGIQDTDFLKSPENRALMSAFLETLESNFERGDNDLDPYVFWQRKNQETQP